MESKNYVFWNDDGDAVITVYEVFPGVQLAYHSIHLERLHLEAGMEGKLIEIHYCREGRIERQFENDFFYLTPGDLSIAIKEKEEGAYHFPMGHYHGMTIGINLDAVPEIFKQMLLEVGVQPEEIAERLCADKPCCILRAEKQIEQILAELYSVSDDIREGYYKIKIMELYLALSRLQIAQNQLPVCALSKTNVALANRAAAYLSLHMDEHVTIAELSRMLGVSQSHLKTIFKSVFGVPVFAYTRIHKMQNAGHELTHTDKSTAEIAEEFGYINVSKFAAAFQKVMGESPSEYRRAHGKKSFRV